MKKKRSLRQGLTAFLSMIVGFLLGALISRLYLILGRVLEGLGSLKSIIVGTFLGFLLASLSVIGTILAYELLRSLGIKLVHQLIFLGITLGMLIEIFWKILQKEFLSPIALEIAALVFVIAILLAIILVSLLFLQFLIVPLSLSLIANFKNQSSQDTLELRIKLNKWIYKILSDEEQTVILIDYRIEWYGDKRPNKWTHFKVWLKTLHYLFYEVWFKEKLDKMKSFQIRIPRR